MLIPLSLSSGLIYFSYCLRFHGSACYVLIYKKAAEFYNLCHGMVNKIINYQQKYAAYTFIHQGEEAVNG